MGENQNKKFFEKNVSSDECWNKFKDFFWWLSVYEGKWVWLNYIYQHFC